MPDMYAAKKPIMIAGSVLLVAGFIFILQSEGTIGPESSFMYSNPEWHTNGKAIMLIGGAACLAGMFIRRGGNDGDVSRSDGGRSGSDGGRSGSDGGRSGSDRKRRKGGAARRPSR